MVSSRGLGDVYKRQEVTPAYQKMVNEIFGFDFDTDNTEITGSIEFELLQPTHRFIMIAPNQLYLLGVNADGTNLIVLDLRAELERLYEFETRFRKGGRKRKFATDAERYAFHNANKKNKAS